MSLYYNERRGVLFSDKCQRSAAIEELQRFRNVCGSFNEINTDSPVPNIRIETLLQKKIMFNYNGGSTVQIDKEEKVLERAGINQMQMQTVAKDKYKVGMKAKHKDTGEIFNIAKIDDASVVLNREGTNFPYFNKTFEHYFDIIEEEAVEIKYEVGMKVKNKTSGNIYTIVKIENNVISLENEKQTFPYHIKYMEMDYDVIEKKSSIDFAEFTAAAKKTECSYEKPRVAASENIRSIHAVFGLSGEVGELIDAFKKHIFYGKELDAANVAEEIGDLMYFVAVLCDEHKIDLRDILEKNTAKLKKRYGEKFSEAAALNRDLGAEREVFA